MAFPYPFPQVKAPFTALYRTPLPLLLALLGGDEIVIAASLSVLAILGELIPPTALAANYASRIVGETYPSMAKHFVVPLLFAILVSFLCLTFSSSLSFLTV